MNITKRFKIPQQSKEEKISDCKQQKLKNLEMKKKKKTNSQKNLADLPWNSGPLSVSLCMGEREESRGAANGGKDWEKSGYYSVTLGFDNS